MLNQKEVAYFEVDESLVIHLIKDNNGVFIPSVCRDFPRFPVSVKFQFK